MGHTNSVYLMSTNPFLWDLYFKIVNFMSYRGSQEKSLKDADTANKVNLDDL